MRKRILWAAVLGVVLTIPAAALGDPPARPKPLTSAQCRQLAQLERQPEHMAVRDVQATYTNNRQFDRDFTRASDDFWTIAWQGGFPGTILTLLIMASPL